MVEWDDIAEFERGPSFVGPVVQIRLVSGRTVRAVAGTAAGSPIGGEPSLRFRYELSIGSTYSSRSDAAIPASEP